MQGDSKIKIKVFFTGGLSLTLEIRLSMFPGRDLADGHFRPCPIRSVSLFIGLLLTFSQSCAYTTLPPPIHWFASKKQQQKKTWGKNWLLLYCPWLHRKVQSQQGQGSNQRWRKDTSLSVEQIPARLISSAQMPTKLCANCGRELHQKSEGLGSCLHLLQA